jgi:hypothetical protein
VKVESRQLDGIAGCERRSVRWRVGGEWRADGYPLMAQKQAWECPRCLLRRPSQRLSSRVTSLWPVRTARCVRCVGRVLFGAVVNYESRGRLWVGTGEVGGRGYKKRREVKWANKAFREGTNGSLSRTSADGRRFHRCMHHGPMAPWSQRLGAQSDALGLSLRRRKHNNWRTQLGLFRSAAWSQHRQDVWPARGVHVQFQRCGSKRSLSRRPANGTRGVRMPPRPFASSSATTHCSDLTSACIDCSLLATPTPAPEAADSSPYHSAPCRNSSSSRCALPPRARSCVARHDCNVYAQTADTRRTSRASASQRC